MRARQTRQYDFSNAYESRKLFNVFNKIKVHVKHLDLILGQLIEKVSKLKFLQRSKKQENPNMLPDLLLLSGVWLAGYITGCSCLFLITPPTRCSRERNNERDNNAALLPEPPAPDDGNSPYTMAQVR